MISLQPARTAAADWLKLALATLAGARSRPASLVATRRQFLVRLLCALALWCSWFSAETLHAARDPGGTGHTAVPDVQSGSDGLSESAAPVAVNPTPGSVTPVDRTSAAAGGTGRVHQRANLGWINTLVMAGYLAGMVGIGLYCSRRGGSTDAFFRGGQRIPSWAAGLSIYATMVSSISYMALPAKAYATDWSYLFNTVAIVAVTPVVIAFYLPFFRRLNVTSAYEYLEKRFNVVVSLFGSASFILMQFGRMAIVLYLPAIALSTVSSLDVYLCIVLVGLLCILYTMIGGIEAVVWTDVAQAAILLGGAVLSLGFAILKTDGGLAGFWSLAHQEGKFFENAVWWSSDLTVASITVIFVGSLFNNLSTYTTSQDVVQRYMITSDPKAARRSIWLNARLSLVGSALFFLVGTALFTFFRTHADRMDPLVSDDQILPLFIVQEMPVGVVGLLVAAIFAAAQSTVSSSLNSIASAWITDFHRLIWPDATDRGRLRVAQGIVLFAGLVATGVACVMAGRNIKSLWDSFITVLGLTGGAVCGLFILGIFTRRAHGSGAFIGALASIAALILVQSFTAVSFFLYGAIGTSVCVVVGYAASMIIPSGSKPLAGLTLHAIDRL